MTDSTLVWFRNDLRLIDNPALIEATLSKNPITFVYIFDDSGKHSRPMGGAQKWWLHHSLTRLAQDISKRGGRLDLYRGDPETILPRIVSDIGPTTVVWNRRYHPSDIACDTAIKAKLETDGVTVKTFNGTLIREPWTLASKTGSAFKVFTPFWRAARENYPIPKPLAAPDRFISAVKSPSKHTVSLNELALLPLHPNWAGGVAEAWEPGEAGAAATLDTFIEHGFAGYSENRNRPDMPSTSRLSPYLRFGEISINTVWQASEMAVQSGRTRASSEDLRVFQSELGWREFSYYLLYHQPDIAKFNVQRRFDAFPWQNDPSLLTAWQKGQTGYPIIDAGMRELWQTGFMHNRVRMIVASFLIKHLKVDWREGEIWFWDTLVDADPASNPASWQWVAGSGADAAPFFRIFNPMLQGEKFDPKGDYVRHYVPEVARLSPKYIHTPWAASPVELAAAGVKLGQTYPRPIVDHETARNSALAAFKALT
jgi:deoxyribodipyrimidine photo-lyase